MSVRLIVLRDSQYSIMEDCVMKCKYILIFYLFMMYLVNVEQASCQWNYYIRDHLGNTRVVLDEDGDTYQFFDYYPFGLSSREDIGGAEKERFLFTGKELDEEGELDWYYFGARYYDPSIGRWLTPEPNAEKYPSISPYVYSLNNPLGFIDPDGRDVWGVGRCASVGLILGGTIGSMAVMDDKGNQGFINYYGGGAFLGAGASSNTDFLYAPGVEDIYQLAGKGEAWGASGTIVPGVAGVTFEGMMTGGYPKQTPEGGTLSGYLGIGSLSEVHSFVTKTKVMSFTKAEMKVLSAQYANGFIPITFKNKVILINPTNGKIINTKINMVSEGEDVLVSEGIIAEREEENEEK